MGVRLFETPYSIKTYLLILLFLLFFFIGGLNKYAVNNIVDKRKLFAKFPEKGALAILIVFSLACFVFFNKFLPQFISNPRMFMNNRINILSGNGYLLTLSSIGSPLFFLYFYFFRFKSKKYFFTLLYVFILNIGVATLKGSRGAVIEPIFLVLLSELLFNNVKINFGKIFKIGFGVFVIFFVVAKLGEIRQSHYINAATKSAIEKVTTELRNSFNHSEYLNVCVTSETELLYGKTYLAALVLPIPRKIWKGKPLGGGPYLKNIVKPGSYDLNKRKYNSSLTTGVLIESYLNFGFLGAIVFGFIYGRISKKLTYALFYKINKPSVEVIMFFCYFLLFFVFSFGEFLGAFTRIINYILPFLIFGGVFSIKSKFKISA
jgi:oligosaccharide repeat unit polymerase